MTVYLLKDDSSIKFQYLECDFLFSIVLARFFELNHARLEFCFSFVISLLRWELEYMERLGDFTPVILVVY